jgi:hypothetical protein
VWTILAPQTKNSASPSSKRWFWIALLLAPAVISIFMWKYVPLISGSLMAAKDYKLVGHSPWVGFGNLAEVLFDPSWWASVGKTLYYMAISLGFGFLPPIILAIMLQEVSHAKLLYRVIFYLPAVISGVIVIYLWKLLYAPGADLSGSDKEHPQRALRGRGYRRGGFFGQAQAYRLPQPQSADHHPTDRRLHHRRPIQRFHPRDDLRRPQ